MLLLLRRRCEIIVRLLEFSVYGGIGGAGLGGWIGWGYVQHEISIYEVVECLKEDGKEAETGEEAGESGDYPVDVCFVTRPAEPEKTQSK